MKTATYPGLDSMTPFVWAGALLFFVIAEALVLATAKLGASGISPLHRWSMVVVFTSPLACGYRATVRVRNVSRNPDYSETVSQATAGIAMLVFLTYAVLTGTVATFL
jgi:hypothetical protein